MTLFEAIEIAEGLDETAQPDDVIDAWQYLHDTGLAYQLQGFFGRNCAALLEAGIIHD